MSVSDDLMLRYYELVSAMTFDGLQKIKADIKSGALHPMEAKKRLAAEMVGRFCGPGEARRPGKSSSRYSARRISLMISRWQRSPGKAKR